MAEEINENQMELSENEQPSNLHEFRVRQKKQLREILFFYLRKWSMLHLIRIYQTTTVDDFFYYIINISEYFLSKIYQLTNKV